MSSLKVDNITGRGNAGFTGSVKSDGGNTTTDLQQGLNKAWCTADENSSSVIRDSFNVGTLTDNTAGDTSFNISSAMADTNFSGVGMSSVEGSAGSYDVISEISNSRTTSLIRLISVNYNNGGNNESEYKMMQICGDLA
jgi:hypothetical protein